MLGDFKPDVIIVGAGSAGCVVADLLSRRGDTKVLVVEAGGAGRWNPWIKIPLGFGKTFADPGVNWCYDTAIDTGLGRADFWPRGKVWGGSSSINGLVWIQPLPSDIDGWAARGLDGWSWKHLRGHFDQVANRGQGAGNAKGAVPVESPKPFFDASDKRLHQAYFDAGESMQLSLTDSFDASSDTATDLETGKATNPVPNMLGYYHTNTANGMRVGCREAFLVPAIKRRNVRILSGFDVASLVTEDDQVRGVRDASGQAILAAREVILSAGSIGSPVIMLRSGLQARLPHIGQNLTDHLGINYSYRSRIATTNSRLNRLWARGVAGLEYALRRRGPLGLGINPAGGFVRTDPNLDQPNIQLYLQSLTTTSGFQKAKTGERPLLEPDPFDAFSMGLSTCRPKSRGSIEITANGAPVIQPNSFSHPDDMDEFIAGVKFLRALASTKPLADIIESEITPGVGVQSDEALEADIRARCGTVYHPVSTCRMAANEADGVVDATGKVFGLNGLRVVDASIFPTQISVNTNATTVALAHKIASDMLSERVS